MNINPTLLIALAIQKAGELLPVEKTASTPIQLRVYDPEGGTGFWFVTAHSPGRWYWSDGVDADGFRRADLEQLDAAIDAGARVQLVGFRSRSLGLWPTWADFEAAMR